MSQEGEEFVGFLLEGDEAVELPVEEDGEEEPEEGEEKDKG